MKADTEQGEIAGFSLVEMLVVLAIAAIVFSIGAVSLSALRGRLTSDHYADRIVAMLNDSNDRAMAGSTERTVSINLKRKIFTNGIDPDIELPENFRLTVTVGKETVTDARKLDVIFLPDGTCSGAEIAIADTQGRSIRIVTNWLTGLTGRADVDP